MGGGERRKDLPTLSRMLESALSADERINSLLKLEKVKIVAVKQG